MNTEKMLNVHKSQASLRAALTRLEEAGVDVSHALADFKATLSAFETHVPTDIPTEFNIRSSPIPFSDHLTLGKDMLPCNLHPISSTGRAYTLTKGQRAILNDQFGMTPTKEVIVDEIATWPAAPTSVAHIVIRSTEHVPDRRRHVLNAATITDWPRFCGAALAIDSGEVDAAQKIIVHDVKGNYKVLSRSGYNELKADGLLYSRYPDAPQLWPEPRVKEDKPQGESTAARPLSTKLPSLASLIDLYS